MSALRAQTQPSVTSVRGPRRGRRLTLGAAVAIALTTSACAAGQQAETAEESTTLDGTNAEIGNIALRGLAVYAPDAANYPAGSALRLRLVMVNSGQSTDSLTSISSTQTSGWSTFDGATAYSAAAEPSTTPPATTVSSASGTATSTGTPSTGSTATSETPSTGNSTSGATATAPPSTGLTSTDASSSSAPDLSTSPVSVSPGSSTSFGVPAADGRILALLDSKALLYPGSTIAIRFTFAKAGSKTIQVPIEITDAGSYTPSPSYFPSGTRGNEEGS